jgi:putative ABC transport system permease protein
MIKNYLLTSIRSFWRYKFFSSLNIIGLSIGFACAVLIALFLWEEINYDNFHENGDRIVRLNMEIKMAEDVSRVVLTGTKVGPAFKRDFPEVEEFVRFMKYPLSVSIEDQSFEEKNFLFADSTIFDVFTFKMLEGNPKNALNAPQKIVLSESTAKRYFGNESAIGKTIKTSGTKEYEVTGVVKDAPSNSQIKFDLIASFSSLSASQSEEWWTANYVTYLLLGNNVDQASFQEKIRPYMDSKMEEHQMRNGNYLTYFIEPIKEVHLHSAYTGLEPNMDIRYVYIFAFVAILIIIIACINYMNLATAKASERAREVGLRKVLGADRGQLIRQFLGEAFILAIVAGGVSYLLIEASVPLFETFTGSNIFLTEGVTQKIFVSIIILIFTATFLAGTYPAIILSKFAPQKTIKGSFKSSEAGLLLRKSLIVFQFAVSIILLISTKVISDQMNYIRDKNLGFQKEHILVQTINYAFVEKFDAVKDFLKQHPEIEEVTMGYNSPHSIGWGDNLMLEGMDQGKMINANPVEKDFIKTFKIKLLAGRDFNDQDYPSTQSGEVSYLLNETAVKELGLTPESVIGKKRIDGRLGYVVGVIEDFHFSSLHEKIGPLMLFSDRMYNEMFVSIKGNNVGETIAHLEKGWKESGTLRPFNYRFLNDDYNSMYNSEQKLGQLFSLFAGLAIFLGCLGLLGLSAFSIAQRAREISIRKVLGATSFNLVTLLSKDFIKLVIISYIIAAPISYYAMNEWLQNFNYKEGISAVTFLISGGIVLLLTFLTLSSQTITAAGKNPADVIRQD